ncbi:hypothetical protein BDU57DRAFT_591882 [Ampelomyces quisqualis]|uniref:Uncharacterized protein n=1 Tax=Ampelomyces quisqualis TaxID=50730 RepID=A0A6A5R4M6_AMPQU|nr:hypothetical protein BDU57DRAFT_591882 [Ampelomyces quisqualis]
MPDRPRALGDDNGADVAENLPRPHGPRDWLAGLRSSTSRRCPLSHLAPGHLDLSMRSPAAPETPTATTHLSSVRSAARARPPFHHLPSRSQLERLRGVVIQASVAAACIIRERHARALETPWWRSQEFFGEQGSRQVRAKSTSPGRARLVVLWLMDRWALAANAQGAVERRSDLPSTVCCWAAAHLVQGEAEAFRYLAVWRPQETIVIDVCSWSSQLSSSMIFNPTCRTSLLTTTRPT